MDVFESADAAHEVHISDSTRVQKQDADRLTKLLGTDAVRAIEDALDFRTLCPEEVARHGVGYRFRRIVSIPPRKGLVSDMADICNEHLNWHAVVRIAFGNACVVDKTMKGWTLNNLCLEIDPWMHPWWVDVCRCITSIGMCLPNDIWIRTQVACKGIKIIVMGELVVAPVGIPVTKTIMHHRDCVPVVVVVDPYPLDHVHDSIHGEK